jgi:hypothetical protein
MDKILAMAALDEHLEDAQGAEETEAAEPARAQTIAEFLGGELEVAA